MADKTDTKDGDAVESKELVEKSLEVIREDLVGIVGNGSDVYVRYDDMYSVCMVYLYCDVATADAVHIALYGSKGEGCEAVALASKGFYIEDRLKPVTVVWLNSSQRKEDTIPALVHELSHVADMVLEHAQVDDKSGEARAYFMEREMRYVLSSLYGIDTTTLDISSEVRRKINEAMKSVDREKKG